MIRIFDTMKPIIRKQPAGSDDYINAHELANTIKRGHNKTIAVDNLKAFRKYVHEIGAKTNKTFTTKRQDDNNIIVFRLT